MAELMGDTLLKNDSSESTELMPLVGVPMQKNPFDLLPNEIFQEVIRLLDQHSLRQTRLICRKWNDFALIILSKTPGRLKLNNKDDGRIQKLQSILRLTECPEMFFSKLEMYSFVLERKIQLLNLLPQFGSTLKSLHLHRINLTLPILREMLENWCPDLEELALWEITVTEDENNNIEDFEISPTPVKLLKIRKFYAGDHYKDLPAQPLPAAQNFFLSILRSSPELEVLDLDIHCGFWKNIRNLTEITKNLKEVKLDTLKLSREGISDLSLLNDASFSNKLTSLTLFISHAPFAKEQLVRLLYKLGESLEKLVLHLYVWLDWKIQSKLQLPLMNKLKFLEYSFTRKFIFHTIDFLQKMPNLETLNFSRSREETNQSEVLDILFSNLSNPYLSKRPHKTLNTLFIRGYFRSPETIFAMNRMFPNIRNLTLEIDCSETPESTKECCLTRFCIRFSEMENLKTLHICFHRSLTWDQEFNFKACFSPLEASQSLEELKISRKYKTFDWPDTLNPNNEKLPPGLEQVFVKIPKLKLLTLNGFHLEQSESMKLFKNLGQKGILLNQGEGYHC